MESSQHHTPHFLCVSSTIKHSDVRMDPEAASTADSQHVHSLTASLKCRLPGLVSELVQVLVFLSVLVGKLHMKAVRIVDICPRSLFSVSFHIFVLVTYVSCVCTMCMNTTIYEN